MKKTPILLLILMVQTLTAIEIKDEVKNSIVISSISVAVDNSDKYSDFEMGSDALYPLVTSSDKKIEENINNAITPIVNNLNGDIYIHKVVEKYDKKNLVKIRYTSRLNIELLLLLPKTFTLKVSEEFEFEKGDSESEDYFLNYDLFTGKELSLDDFFIKDYEKKLRDIIEKSYREQYINGDEEKYKKKLLWIKNNFTFSRNLGFGKEGLYVDFFPKDERFIERKAPEGVKLSKDEERKIHQHNMLIINKSVIKMFASLEGENSIVIPYSNLKSIIKKGGYLDFKIFNTKKTTKELHEK